jgi:hypothetical protein
MFKKLFGKKELGKAFVIGFHVKPMENSIMPPNMGGAYVDCFSKGDGYEQATKKALEKLISDGLHPEEIIEPILELEVSEWSNYAKERWPSYIESVATQSEFEEAILSGGVIYGPFGAYNPQ